MFYATAYECSTLNSCNTSTTKLYAFSVPGLAMDYPRGAILRHDEPLKKYVAMGDSFSSGQGSVLPYEAGTDTAGPPEDRCRRSSGAYARLLGEVPGPRLDLARFVACGGATTSDVQNGRYSEDSQLDALSIQDPDVVTVTIGGNDIGFDALVQACVAQLDCTQSSAYANAEDQLNNHLAENLQGLFGEIGERLGSTARVLVIGYPLLIPTADTPTSWPSCLYLSDTEKTAAREVITGLNQKLSDAVVAAGSRFEYVDPNTTDSPFRGHELCNDGSYFNGIVAPPNDSSSMHPNALGQDAYAQVLMRYLGQ